MWFKVPHSRQSCPESELMIFFIFSPPGQCWQPVEISHELLLGVWCLVWSWKSLKVMLSSGLSVFWTSPPDFLQRNTEEEKLLLWEQGWSPLKKLIPKSSLSFFFFFNKFIFKKFLAVLGLRCCAWTFSLVAAGGATLQCSAQPSHCGGFSCCKAQALGTWASVVVAHGLSSCGSRALERRLSSCSTRV